MKKIKSLFLILCLFVPLFLVGCENANQSQLSVPTNVEVKNGIIIFDAVDKADVYVIYINDLSLTFNVNYSSNVEIVNNKINYNAQNVLRYNKTYSIKVKATADDMKESFFTTPISYTHSKGLNVPSNVRVTSSTLTWGVVDSASYYMVKAENLTNGDNSIFKCDTNCCLLTGVFAQFGAGEYSFAVKAVRTGNSPADTEYTAPIMYEYYKTLSTPTILSITSEGGKVNALISVDGAANALSIMCGNITKTAKLNGTDANVNKVGQNYKINLSGLFGNDLNDLKTYTFSAVAKYETTSTSYIINSQVSEKTTFTKTETLAVPTISLNYDSQLGNYMATWQRVNNASGYVLVVLTGTVEQEYLLDKDSTSMLISGSFTKVKIKAVGIGNYLDSAYSAYANK